tara:strand:- start:1103 stop:2710 length:1608 start_codon:yes stop_codon:yes gene_type:complete
MSEEYPNWPDTDIESRYDFPDDDAKVKELPKHMTKGGPGDKSTGGNVNTDSWFVEPAKQFDSLGNKKFSYIPDILDKGTIAQQAKDKEIFFCDIPFTQLYMEIDGNYQPCCFGKPDGKHNILNTSMREWMVNSEALNGIRKEMVDPNEKEYKNVNKYCTRCVSDEKRYGKSRRTACMKIHTNDSEFWGKVNRSAKMFKASGLFDFDERIIEVQLKVYGSECNLDCYMCTHQNSTIRQKVANEGVWNDAVFGKLSEERLDHFKWVTRDKTNIIKEPDVILDEHGDYVIPKLKAQVKIENKKSMVDQTLDMAPYIRSIKIIGGEPLIMKKHYELLDKLIESGHAKHIYLKYQTNLTETKGGKHNIFDYIPKFKRVSMVASVDGIGQTIEYMRRRCDWEKIKDNLKLCAKYPNVDADFNGLVSFLSVMRFYEVIDWCMTEGKDLIDQVNWAMLESPPLLRANNLPQKIKDDLIPKYEGWPDIQEALRMPAEEGLDIQEVFDYLLDADKYYEGTKWEKHLFKVFPELEEYYIPKHQRNR